MIDLEKYWMGRDVKYKAQLTEEISKNAKNTVDHVNGLLALASIDGIIRDKVSSGWRPPAVNDATSNAAKKSTHLTGQAVDIYDKDRVFAQWCILNQDKMDACGLWAEDFRWTFSKWGNHWCHFQVVPPRSGKRIYIPSSKPPRGEALEGQKPYPHTVRV